MRRGYDDQGADGEGGWVMENDDRCRFCRWWEEWTDVRATWGTCMRITPKQTSHVAGASLTKDAFMNTGPDFGCVLWEERDKGHDSC